ncbi:MAG: hypothetical protein ACXIUM_08955 [Wenzhouxiangella sp.]
MSLIWLLLVLFLGWLGLPWFAALGLSLLLFAALSGMDSLLIMLEFSALRGMEQLLAIPLLWCAARLLLYSGAADAAHAPVLKGLEEASGRWLLGPASEPAARCDGNPAWTLLPGVSMLTVWLLISSLSPARTPGLPELFLAGLMPFVVVWCLFAGVARTPTAGALSTASFLANRNPSHWAAALATLPLLGGLYLGRWNLLEAAAVLLALIAVMQVGGGRITFSQLRLHALAASRDFGQLALLLGLGLAWIVLVFDNGLDRTWLEPLGRLVPMGDGLLLPGLWLSLVWLLAAWKLKPMPALVLGAPWLLPGALQLGIPSTSVILLTVLSLHSGQRLSLHPALSARRLGSELLRLQLAVALLLGVPGLTSWLPPLFA